MDRVTGQEVLPGDGQAAIAGVRGYAAELRGAARWSF
jgi:hypothetical protein